MKKITREEIDRRLSKLRESNLNEETYTMTRPAFAMCYSISFDGVIPDRVIRKCDICGEDFKDIIIYPGFSDEIYLSDYEDAIDKFAEHGVDAKVACHCDSCVKEHNVYKYEIHIKSEDENSYHVSYPKDICKYADNVKTVSIFELSLVRKFLSVPLETAPLDSFFDRLYNVEFREMEKNFFKDKPLLDFSAEKELTFLKAINMVKEHIGYVEEEFDMYRGYNNNNNYIYHRFSGLCAERYLNLTYRGINGENEV